MSDNSIPKAEVTKHSAYMEFSEAKVAKTIEFIQNKVFIDVDKAGNVVGVEYIRWRRDDGAK